MNTTTKTLFAAATATAFTLGVVLDSSAAVVVATVTETVATDTAGGFQGSPGNLGDTEANPISAASSTDLLNGLAAESSSGTFTAFGSGGLSKLTDGSADAIHGLGSDSGNYGTYFSPYAIGSAPNGTTATYDLGGTFDLASVVIYGGWIDGGRDQQNVNVLVSYNGTDFVSLGTTLGGNAGGSDLIFHRNTITADNSEFDGVQKIRFDFGNTEASGTGYSEIDVFAVPEPGSLALLGLGGLCVLRRRRG